MDLFKKLIFTLMLVVLHFELRAEEIKEYSIANTFTFQSKNSQGQQKIHRVRSCIVQP